MRKHIYIGMDVHKETITLATAEGPGGGEVREYGTIANSLHALKRALRNIQKPDVILHCVYEVYHVPRGRSVRFCHPPTAATTEDRVPGDRPFIDAQETR